MDVTKISLHDRSTAEQAAEAATALQEYLRVHPSSSACLRLGEGSGENKQILVPAAAFAVFAAMLGELAQGHTLTIAPADTELTLKQAADLLNVSAAHLIELLESGRIPHHRAGQQRVIVLTDLLDYKRRDRARREAILDELTAEAQEMGLYD